MNEKHVDRAMIPPVPEGAERPVWSVLIPCYNCAGLLEATLKSVIDQDPGPERMEILVIDDCSDKDNPADVVERVGKGRIRFLRQACNVGKVRNYETGLLASRGHLIHQLHGDDMVLPGFYSAMESAFARFPEAGAFFCESDYIDENGAMTGRTGVERDMTGILDDWLRRIVVKQRIQTPSMVVRRTVYENLGGFDRRLDCSEDWEMWIRIASRFPVGFCVEARARYRSSVGNNSYRSIVTGTRFAIQMRMFEIVDGYLPPVLVAEINAERSRQQALFFCSQIPMAMKAKGLIGTLQLIRQVLRFSSDLVVIRRVAAMVIAAV